MSTSIQEQDLIQEIKDLKQRLSDLERQQRTIGSSIGSFGVVKIDSSGVSIGNEFESNAKVLKIEDAIFLELYDVNGDFDNKIELLWGKNVPYNYYFWISGVSSLVTDANQIIMGSKTPASSSATGEPGTICVDANFIYVCVAPNTWKRATLNSY